MLTAEARRRLTVVLVGARNPQNIGAAARAMQDFGFSDLRVVNAFAPPFEAAQLEAKSAVGAQEVMRSARLYTALQEAIADCNIVVGTTAIGGRGLTRAVETLQSVGPRLLQKFQDAPESTAGEEAKTQHRVALLFGSEKTGLTNEQLSFCSDLLTIPMYAPEGRHLSMNLGQSVAVCLYELSRAGFEGSRTLPPNIGHAAEVGTRERLLEKLLETMRVSGYSRRFPANARPEVVRRLAGQLGTTQEEVSTWLGYFRQLLRVLPASDQRPESPEK